MFLLCLQLTELDSYTYSLNYLVTFNEYITVFASVQKVDSTSCGNG